MSVLRELCTKCPGFWVLTFPVLFVVIDDCQLDRLQNRGRDEFLAMSAVWFE